MSAINGFNAGFSVRQTTQSQSAQSARPQFAHNKTWNSIGEMDTALRNHTKDWAGYYTGAFAGTGAGGDGKITRDELDGLLQSEFGGMGIKFTDGPVDESNPREGTYEVYIDDKTRQKMADDSGYRAKVMAVIQSEMAANNGYSVKNPRGEVTNGRTTSLSMNMQEGGPIYEGVPHSAGGTGITSGPVVRESGASSGGKKKSMLEQMLERLEEKKAEKKEAEKKAAAKKAREDVLEISADARIEVKDGAGAKPAVGEAADAVADETEKGGGALNVLA